MTSLPISVDLRPQINFVEDQGSLGTCVAFAKNKSLSILYERDGKKLDFSEKYIYYYARLLSNTLGQEGSSPELANAVLKTKGVCLDASWPYTSPTETQPPITLDAEAAQYRITSYATMNWTEDPMNWMKKHLAGGKPINVMMHLSGDFDDVAGTYKNWRQTDWTPSRVSRGAHEVTCIGYDDTVERFLIQNSWGPNWADGGFFGMTYKNFMDANCASLVDCITGFDGALHPAWYSREEVVAWYNAYNLKADDEGVAWWRDPAHGGKYNFLIAVRDAIVDRCNKELASIP